MLGESHAGADMRLVRMNVADRVVPGFGLRSQNFKNRAHTLELAPHAKIPEKSGGQGRGPTENDISCR